MNDSEKLKFIETALEQGLEAMRTMASSLRDMSDCLEDMTNHYAALVNCGDCGNWNPETESEVIAARKMISEVREAIAGLTFSRALNTEADTVGEWVTETGSVGLKVEM